MDGGEYLHYANNDFGNGHLSFTVLPSTVSLHFKLLIRLQFCKMKANWTLKYYSSSIITASTMAWLSRGSILKHTWTVGSRLPDPAVSPKVLSNNASICSNELFTVKTKKNTFSPCSATDMVCKNKNGQKEHQKMRFPFVSPSINQFLDHQTQISKFSQF